MQMVQTSLVAGFKNVRWKLLFITVTYTQQDGFFVSFLFLASKSQGKKTAITSSDRAAVFLELADAHMEAGQLVN